MDQKCQSFKSFINLMETNYLFKELRTDPKKLQENMRDKYPGTLNYRGNNVNSSMYLSSVAGANDHETSRTQAASSIADDFLKDIARDMGMDLR